MSYYFCAFACFIYVVSVCVVCLSDVWKINRRISREWRQKIESWLQANEQDERQADEHKRRARRLTGNRRSYENDSGKRRWVSKIYTMFNFF